MEDVEAVVKQPNTIILPDTSFLYPPSTLLTDNFPFCRRDGSWFNYLLLLQKINDIPILERAVEEIVSYTDGVKLLQHENVYSTSGVFRELQDAIRFFSRKYRTPVNGHGSESRMMIKDTIRETIKTYRQLRRFLLERLLEGPYLDTLGIYCNRYYRSIEEAIDNVRFPYGDEPDDKDKELIKMTVYVTSLSSNRRIVALSNDHHVYQGIPRVCEYLRNKDKEVSIRVSDGRLSVMGVNRETGRLEVKSRTNFLRIP